MDQQAARGDCTFRAGALKAVMGKRNLVQTLGAFECSSGVGKHSLVIVTECVPLLLFTVGHHVQTCVVPCLKFCMHHEGAALRMQSFCPIFPRMRALLLVMLIVCACASLGI